MKTFFRSLLMLICILIASCHRLPEGVVKCIECKGKGKVIICKYCKEGYYYCSRCSRGWIVCQYCQNGYQKCINCQTGYTLCHYCNMGYQPCSKCNNGLITIQPQNGVEKPRKGTCKVCMGSGKKRCGMCKGAYKKPCRICHGSSKRLCIHCKGVFRLKRCPQCDGEYSRICPYCGGDYSKECPKCGGLKYIRLDYKDLKNKRK